MVQEIGHGLAAFGGLSGGVQQFVQVLQPDFRFGRPLQLQHLAIAGALQGMCRNKSGSGEELATRESS